jgi:tetratricopeptide (TPR) repeat protein
MWIGQIHNKIPAAERAGWVATDWPRSERAHYKYGIALQDSNRVAEAEEHFRTALQLNPNTEGAEYDLAHTLLVQSKFDEAALHLEQALRKDPRNGEFHSDYGYVLEQLGQKEKAVAEFAAANRLSPKSGRMHYGHAMFILRDNRLDEAAEEFQASLSCNPKSSETHYFFGRVLFLKRDWEGAKQHYLEAARLDPAAPVRNSLGVTYMRLGQVSEAIKQFQEALRQHPDDAAAAENLRFALDAGQTDAATRP